MRRRRSPRGTQRPLVVLAAAFGAFFLLYALWSVATPLFAAPDEPVQMIKAVAVAHGQLIGDQRNGAASPYTYVRVPEVYAHAGLDESCFTFKFRVPASCAPPVAGRAEVVPIRIYTGRYPPLYYAIVGLPSLAMSSAGGIYAMRLVSAAISAFFLALAVTVVVTWSRSRLLLVGLAVAVTPSALFFGGVINPSGFEVSTNICLWCSALVLGLERADEPPPWLVAVVGISACATVLVRGLSPLWVAMTGLAVLALTQRQAIVSLVRRRSVQVAGGALVLAGVLALAWIVHAHTLDVVPSTMHAPASARYGQLLVITLDHTGRFVREMVGEFGWLDTPSPFATQIAWYGALGLLVLGAAAVARRRQALVLAAVIAATVFVPALISASQAHKEGYVWQGKDSLPFAVGVPLVAAQLLGLSGIFEPVKRRLAGVVTGVLAVAAIFAFVGTLRRYAVGVDGPLNFLFTGWRPPLGSLTLVVVEVLVAAGAAAGITVLTAPRPVGSDLSLSQGAEGEGERSG
jgi:MYXO-CTERM domain-containing protein